MTAAACVMYRTNNARMHRAARPLLAARRAGRRLTMRGIPLSCALCLAALSVPFDTFSQDYPNRPIRLVVAQGTGGTGDTHTRIPGPSARSWPRRDTLSESGNMVSFQNTRAPRIFPARSLRRAKYGSVSCAKPASSPSKRCRLRGAGIHGHAIRDISGSRFRFHLISPF